MKKFFSLIFTLVFALSLSVGVYAAPAQTDEIPLNDFSIDVSVDDLQDGITVAIEENGNGEYTVRQISSAEAMVLENNPSTRILGTFHCGLDYDASTSTGHIHWNATGDRLTRVDADVFCKSTSILFPEIYFEGAIDGYRDLRGRYNTAEGGTDDFDIPSGVEKVRVGWSSATVATITNTTNIGGASQAVSIG